MRGEEKERKSKEEKESRGRRAGRVRKERGNGAWWARVPDGSVLPFYEVSAARAPDSRRFVDRL